MLKTIREGEKTTRQRGLLWTGMWKQQNAAEYSWGGKGDINSVALTAALVGDQVKVGGREPTDSSRKRKEKDKGERGI